MWAGTIVHETIAEALNRFAQKGTPIQVGDLQARARTKLREGWLQAVNREWLQYPKRTNLHELYYGNGKTLPKERTDRMRDRVYQCLAAFVDSAVLREILATPYLHWKPADKLDSFSLSGLKVWCAIDFAYADPAGGLRILDWKTGAEQKAALQTQLACYALYAAEKWFSRIESVRLYGVFLTEGARVSEYTVSPEIIVEAQDRILTSAAAMRAKLTDQATNTAREDDFPGCGEARTCRWCNYREVCPVVTAAADVNAAEV